MWYLYTCISSVISIISLNDKRLLFIIDEFNEFMTLITFTPCRCRHRTAQFSKMDVRVRVKWLAQSLTKIAKGTLPNQINSSWTKRRYFVEMNLKNTNNKCIHWTVNAVLVYNMTTCMCPCFQIEIKLIIFWYLYASMHHIRGFLIVIYNVYWVSSFSLMHIGKCENNWIVL